ncbi:histidinol-phosphate transaminase [Kocuria sp. cx-455]|uniref:histidinol-phosphate transaminase n=1 Tax=unclassified Candidatus Sulfotelmatobacter TaxID=2635724 RepID=UPI0016890548|nr:MULTISPECIES: histidinol-phosphate transaminase [unclassified Candidatus Sulfotelmatobacter]MBD2761950.1 histidinol-phosphate transaminase [Kocuria sp. cx-116]MBD2763820.1 histidinol-phosphate transaminase [Kocuria sp. cx-455]
MTTSSTASRLANPETPELRDEEPRVRDVVSQLPGYVAGRRATGDLTAALASNESHYEPLPAVVDTVQRSAHRMNRYPDMAATELRERLADFVAVEVGEVSVGPGSVGVLQQILAATCGPGDQVIFAWRSFEAYPILVSLTGATPVPVPLNADEGHDLEAMLTAITDRTRVVMVCSPNNPTGVALEHEDLARFLDRVPPHVLVVIDEAYTEYLDADQTLDALALFRAHNNVCVLRTFSKAYGLAGLRVGYAVAHPKLAEALRRVALPFGVSTLAQQAALASLEAQEQLRERVAAVVSERRRLLTALRRAGWDVPHSQANFVWLRAGEELRRALVDAFDRSDVLVRAYAGDGVRITLADPVTNDRVLEVLKDRSAFPAA